MMAKKKTMPVDGPKAQKGESKSQEVMDDKKKK